MYRRNMFVNIKKSRIIFENYTSIFKQEKCDDFVAVLSSLNPSPV